MPPQTGLAAYRVADSPLNVVTPLMVYLPFMVTVAQRYQKDVRHRDDHRVDAARTSIIIAIVWILLFVLWFITGAAARSGLPGPGLTGRVTPEPVQR